MATRPYTAELHDKVLCAFAKLRGKRRHGQVSVVARECGCSRETVKRAYLTGWPERDLPPIKELLEHENVVRRVLASRVAETAEARRAAEALVSKAKTDVDKLKAEAKALDRRMAEVAKFDAEGVAEREVAMIRGLSTVILRTIAFAEQAFQPDVVLKLTDAVRTGVLEGKVDLKEAKGFFFTLGVLAERLAHAGEVCMDMERKRLGQPTEIVKVETQDLSEAEIIKRLRPLDRIGDLVRQRFPELGVGTVEDAAVEGPDEGEPEQGQDAAPVDAP